MSELRVHRGPFGLATLEEAYWQIVCGYDEPDRLACSYKTRQRLAALCKFHSDGVLMFNNAAVIVDETLPDERLRFTNSRHPDDGKTRAVSFGSIPQLTYDNMNIEVEFTNA